jgi:hypothetical protein
MKKDCLATAVGIPAVLHALWILSRIGTKKLAVYICIYIYMRVCFDLLAPL